MGTEPDHFYITLFRSDSRALFPENSPNAFTCELAQAIDLDPRDTLEVGLFEFWCPPSTVGNLKPVVVVGGTNAIIYCNLIQLQYVGVDLVRCLRTIILPTTHCEYKFTHILSACRKTSYQTCKDGS
jgi:hypothetical protein